MVRWSARFISRLNVFSMSQLRVQVGVFGLSKARIVRPLSRFSIYMNGNCFVPVFAVAEAELCIVRFGKSEKRAPW